MISTTSSTSSTSTGETPAQFVRDDDIAMILEMHHSNVPLQQQQQQQQASSSSPYAMSSGGNANYGFQTQKIEMSVQTETALATTYASPLFYKILQIRNGHGKLQTLIDLIKTSASEADPCSIVDEVSSARATLTAAMAETKKHRNCTARMEARNKAHAVHLAAAGRALRFVQNVVPQKLAQLEGFALEDAGDATGDCDVAALEAMIATTEALQTHAGGVCDTYLQLSEKAVALLKTAGGSEPKLAKVLARLEASEVGVHEAHEAISMRTHEIALETSGFVRSQLLLLHSAAANEKTLAKVIEDGSARPDKEALMGTLRQLTNQLSSAEEELEEAGMALKRAQRRKEDTTPLKEAIHTARRQFGRAQRALEGHEQVVADSCIKYYPELAIDEELRMWGGLVRHRQLKEYTELEVLHQGRHAVYRARRTDGVMVVLKQFSSGERDGTKRLLREARALQRLNHPCVAEVTCVFQDRDIFWYMEMPYYAGGDLAGHITKHGATGTRRYLYDVALALACIHQNGLVHCDMKPENVFIGSDGGARLGDFDISKDTSLSMVTATMAPATMAGVRGTKGYIAPEVIAGEQPTRASDIFSFGLMIYDTVTSTPRSVNEAVPEVTRDNVPQDSYELLSKMLSEEPEERPTADQIAHAPFFRANASAPQQAPDFTAPVAWQNREARGEVVDVTRSVKHIVQAMVTNSCTVSALGTGRNNKKGESHTGLEVVQVLRVEHVDLWESYMLQRRQMHERLANKDVPEVVPSCITHGLGTELLSGAVNETHLFHGTQRKWANLIVSQGMDERVCSWGLNGAGLYFAENSSKSDEYMTADASDGLCDMFICRVLMGNPHMRKTRTTEEEQAARRPPCVEGHNSCKEGHESTDSILASLPNKPREFVVYDRARVYPEYLVRIKRTQGETAVLVD